ncbi:glycosyltransferase [Vibrio hyugaensis]|uniref:glycosyltransferase n=1 Tax=Vibrio hyugaensis TaxID=1534743 RepID=UPI003DA17F61
MISVILSVLNRQDDVFRVLKSLSEQTVTNFEVIVVDNGSSDNTINIVTKFSKDDRRFVIVDGSHLKKTPYAARNLGLSKSSGDVVAFIDGYPTKEWMQYGLMEMETGSDLVAGKIVLETRTDCAYELHDSLFYLDTKHTVEEYNRAPTGNLFVKREVFEKIGLFDESTRSGADMIFTSSATKYGFKLSYSDMAKSHYFAREKNGVLEKQKRISLSQPNIWKSENRIAIYTIKCLCKLVIPVNVLKLSKYIDSRSSTKIGIKTKLKLIYIEWKLRYIMCINNLVGLKNMVMPK